MQEIELTLEQLFRIIELEENASFSLDEEYFQSTKIQVKNENGEWIGVKGLIKKEAETTELIFASGHELRCAKTHLLIDASGKERTVESLDEGEVVLSGTNEIDIFLVRNDTGKVETVYDIEVDSENHWYQTSNGLIHHNTLLTSAIVHYANELNMRTLTIVPSTSLLKQTFDYIKQFDIPVGMYGNGKKDNQPNLVATWQTIQNNISFVRDFECIIWDECHLAKSFVAQKILAEAKNTFIRVGLTGTIPKDQLDKMNLISAFGPVIHEVKANDLQKRQVLSSLEINVLNLKYPKNFVPTLVDWADESEFLQDNEIYVNFISTLFGELTGNTLLLMKNIKPAEKLAKKLGVTFISSKLSIDKRQEEFKRFVYKGQHFAIGTYSLLSTGIDIVHINNLILGPTPGKSFTKIIQSIGRGLRRKNGEKEHVVVFDFTSTLRYDKGHSRERIQYYKEAKYPYHKVDIETTDFLNKKDIE